MMDDWVLVEDETGRASMRYWPRCVVPACPNRICLAKGETRFCWPHSSSGQTVDEMIAENAKVSA